jgi:hypothetical protein
MDPQEGQTHKLTPEAPPEAPPRSEEFQLTGDSIIAKIQELVHEGNVRRIILRYPDGSTLVEFPLTVGVVGAVLLPMWAALGAIVALATNLTIVVERHEE